MTPYIVLIGVLLGAAFVGSVAFYLDDRDRQRKDGRGQ